MARYWLNAAAFIRKRNFDVWVPAYYHPHMPAELVNPKPAPREKVNRYRMVATKRRDPTPYRQHVDPNQIQKASYSIEIMLDMFRKKVEFELQNEYDVVEILDGLDRYLGTLRVDVEMGLTKAVEYAGWVIAWREQVYKHYYRYMMTHKDARDFLYPGNDPENNMLSLISMMAPSITRYGETEVDPLKAKAHPPYRVEGLLPKEKNNNPDEMLLMESSLGLSRPSITDDGKDFDFDDFLARR